MSHASFFAGQPVRAYVKPSDTSVTTLLTIAGAGSVAYVEGINIASDSAGADASIWHNDGTTDWPLLLAKTFAADAQESQDFAHPILRDGHSIKVQSSAGSQLTFGITAVQYFPQGAPLASA